LDSQLLCTFATKQVLNELLLRINDNFILTNKCIFVLTTQTPYEVLCTYNIDTSPNTKYLPNTILVHRKKESNTLYSINALNEISKLNTGRVSNSYIVKWEKFRDCLLVTNDNGLRKINTKLFFIKKF